MLWIPFPNKILQQIFDEKHAHILDPLGFCSKCLKEVFFRARLTRIALVLCFLELSSQQLVNMICLDLNDITAVHISALVTAGKLGHLKMALKKTGNVSHYFGSLWAMHKFQ